MVRSFGVIDGDLFAIWAPDGGLAGAVVEVYQGDVVVIAGQPTFVRGTVPEWLVENLCTAEVADIADPPAGGWISRSGGSSSPMRTLATRRAPGSSSSRSSS
jgi:hypothetical protein